VLAFEEFRIEAEGFLRRWPARAEADAFTWGHGSDSVALFKDTDRPGETDELDQVRRWRRELADAGLAWISGPEEYGGRGLPASYQALFDAMARRRAVPGSAELTISLGMIAPTILAHGSEAVKRRYLFPMRRGDIVACQLFSEPQAGSDLASVRTGAVRDGDGWRVTGQKVWTSGAHVSDLGEVLCRTSEAGRHRDLTAFIVDMRDPGVEVRPLRQMTGGAAFNEVFLDDVWVPDDHRLGDVDGGWRVALTTLMHERGAVGGPGFGGHGVFSLDRLRALVQQFGKADDPATRQQVGALVCGLRTASWTRQRFGAEGVVGPETAMLKLALCRDFSRLAAIVTHVVGPQLTADSGEWGTFAWNDFLLAVPGFRLGGGTDEVLKTVIGERVLGLPKS
jgi:alkylation response protein AidB-like acyl-CoA dehydrogenase